jgi:transcription elongation factor GreB
MGCWPFYTLLVGPDEFNIDDGKLSMDSPLGKSLLGRRLGYEIKFSSPKGMRVLNISKIRYLGSDA